jgi:hypothetical protein
VFAARGFGFDVFDDNFTVFETASKQFHNYFTGISPTALRKF